MLKILQINRTSNDVEEYGLATIEARLIFKLNSFGTIRTGMAETRGVAMNFLHTDNKSIKANRATANRYAKVRKTTLAICGRYWHLKHTYVLITVIISINIVRNRVEIEYLFTIINFV